MFGGLGGAERARQECDATAPQCEIRIKVWPSWHSFADASTHCWWMLSMSASCWRCVDTSAAAAVRSASAHLPSRSCTCCSVTPTKQTRWAAEEQWLTLLCCQSGSAACRGEECLRKVPPRSYLHVLLLLTRPLVSHVIGASALMAGIAISVGARQSLPLKVSVCTPDLNNQETAPNQQNCV